MRPSVKWGIVGVVGVVAIVLVAWILWPQPSSGQMQTAEANGVTVTATLRSDGLVFDVILDTHTVDLASYDLVANSRLLVDGQTLQPHGESRTTDNTGHHVEGTLRFDGERHGTLVLVLEDLGGVPERRLEFKP
jgi:hypothetical protein